METPPVFSQEEMRERQQMAAQMMAGQIRKAPGGCLRSILGIIGILILGAIFVVGMDYLVAPWAWGSYLGKPSLTGEWVGTFTLPQGQHGAAYLNLNHNSYYDFRQGTFGYGPYRAPLDGTGQSCIGTAQIQVYTLSGGANENASDVSLGFGANKPTVPAYAFDDLKGAWSGDALTLSGVFTKILDTQDSTLSASEPNQRQPTTIVFHKGSAADLQSACQGLGQ